VSDRILKSILEKSPKKNDANKISVLPIFVDVEHIKNTEPIELKKIFPGFEFYIVMVSRLTHEKQVVWAAEVVKKIRETHPEVALVIVGDGPLRSELAAYNFVKVVGWIKEPAGYLKGANLFLNTSLYEGYGRTLIEAAAAGVPIVTTDVGISQELTDKNGIIIPVADSEALQAAILSVVEGKFIFAKAAIHTQSKEEFLSGMVAGWEACLK
jgi:glycosyltransferase involved in cell wall biosynthesis